MLILIIFCVSVLSCVWPPVTKQDCAVGGMRYWGPDTGERAIGHRRSGGVKVEIPDGRTSCSRDMESRASYQGSMFDCWWPPVVIPEAGCWCSLSAACLWNVHFKKGRFLQLHWAVWPGVLAPCASLNLWHTCISILGGQSPQQTASLALCRHGGITGCRAHQSPLLVICHRLWAVQHLWGHCKLCNEWGAPGYVGAQGRLAWGKLGHGPPSEALLHHAQRRANRAKIMTGAVAPGLPGMAMGTESAPNAHPGMDVPRCTSSCGMELHLILCLPLLGHHIAVTWEFMGYLLLVLEGSSSKQTFQSCGHYTWDLSSCPTLSSCPAMNL